MGQQGYCIPIGLLSSPLTRCNFRLKLAGETINLDCEAVSPGREAATPTAVRDKVERLSSHNGSGQSPAAKRFLVNVELKMKHLATMVLNKISLSVSLRVLIPYSSVPIWPATMAKGSVGALRLPSGVRAEPGRQMFLVHLDMNISGNELNFSPPSCSPFLFLSVLLLRPFPTAKRP